MLDGFYRFLNSLGYTHPLHAPLTHMPIGLTIGAFVFFAVALIWKKRGLEPTARHAAILALIFVFPTILTGILDWLHYFDGVLFGTILAKLLFAAALLLILHLIVIFGKKKSIKNWPLMVLYSLGLISVVFLGYFGFNLAEGLPPSQ